MDDNEMTFPVKCWQCGKLATCERLEEGWLERCACGATQYKTDQIYLNGRTWRGGSNGWGLSPWEGMQ